jgi:hypothetical protein
VELLRAKTELKAGIGAVAARDGATERLAHIVNTIDGKMTQTYLQARLGNLKADIGREGARLEKRVDAVRGKVLAGERGAISKAISQNWHHLLFLCYQATWARGTSAWRSS